MEDKMSILNNSKIVKGVKPKVRPSYRDGHFQKDQPLGPHNFPLSKYVTMRIYGYKVDKRTGIKRPYWLDKQFVTGSPITPKQCGLDGFFDIRPINQVM
jgi:hypothetical protein